MAQQATDVVGNATSVTTKLVKIDNTAPNTSSNATACYTNTATIVLSPTDPLSGVAWTVWRIDNGNPIDNVGTLYDGTTMEGPAGLRAAILKKKDGFLLSFTESFLTYALGRGLTADDMPAVRTILRQAAADDYRFSAILDGIVTSMPS